MMRAFYRHKQFSENFFLKIEKKKEKKMKKKQNWILRNSQTERFPQLHFVIQESDERPGDC